MSIVFIRPGGERHDAGFCERNLNLLAHAQAIELEVGSECGGHGICGRDRLQIPQSARDRFSPITEEERQHLSDQEIAEGWRLSCQCFPQRNELAVEVRTTR